MKTFPSQLGRRAAWTLGAILLFAGQAVQACPGCKQTDGAPLNGDSVGFGLSIFFMLFMIASMIGGLGWMMYRSCQTLAARDRVMLAEEGMEETAVPAARVTPDTPMVGGWTGALAHGHA